MRVQCIDTVKRFHREGKKFTSSTMSALRLVISITFKYAYTTKITVANEYERIDESRIRNIDLDSSTPISERAYSDEEINAMLDYIHTHQQKYPAYPTSYALEFQIICGCRRGEIPPLTWNDVKNGSVFFHREQITVKKHVKTLHDFDAVEVVKGVKYVVGDTVPEYFQIVEHTKTKEYHGICK